MLIAPPSALTELVPLPCKSPKKLFRKDCKAAVPVEPVLLELVAPAPVEPAVAAAPAEPAAPVDESVPLALPPVRAPIRLLNAVLSVDSVPEVRPEDPVEPLSS